MRLVRSHDQNLTQLGGSGLGPIKEFQRNAARCGIPLMKMIARVIGWFNVRRKELSVG